MTKMSDTGDDFKLAIIATGISVTIVSLFHVVIKCLLDFIFVDHVCLGLAVLLVLSTFCYTYSREEISGNFMKTSTTREKFLLSLTPSQSVENAGEHGRLLKCNVIDDVFIGNTSSVVINSSECHQVIVNSKHSRKQRIAQSGQNLMNERLTEGLSKQDINNILGGRIKESDGPNNNRYEQSISQSEQKAVRINSSFQEINNSAMNLGHVKQNIEKSVQYLEHTTKSRQKINNTLNTFEKCLTDEHLESEGELTQQNIRKTEQRLSETKEATQEIKNTSQNEANTVQRIEDSLQTVTNSETAREVIQTVKNKAIGRQASQIIRNTLQIVNNSKKSSSVCS